MDRYEAAERFTQVCKYAYQNHGKMRFPATYEDITAFHVLAQALNALAVKFGGNAVLSVTLHPYYPVFRDKDREDWFWSCGFLYMWVEQYVHLMGRINELKTVAELHENAKEFAAQVNESWEHLVSFYGEEGEALHVEQVQKLWESYQSKQLSLFGDI